MIASPDALDRFLAAQATAYEAALRELQAGAKRGHWMWFIFPQHHALGRSSTARLYGLAGTAEAAAYWQHPVLGERLRTCVKAMNQHTHRSAEQVLGPIDALKFRSCLTLFLAVAPQGEGLKKALAHFYDGVADELTLALTARDGGASATTPWPQQGPG